MNNDYFDEDYFQRGNSKGTVYQDYLNKAGKNPIYREIAEAIHRVFNPKRVLEVGCATGIIVKYLNEFGSEAYGVDVSKWAVENAATSRILLGSADQLPFVDDFFDLVFSCHVLEHLSDSIVNQALTEMTRVSSSFQFHMLPMIGTKPYTGPVNHVVDALKRDPSHVQLHDAAWWEKKFQSLHNQRIDAVVPFKYDNGRCELTYGQIIVKKLESRQNNTPNFQDWIKDAFEQRNSVLGGPTHCAWDHFRFDHGARVDYTDIQWKDAKIELPEDRALNFVERNYKLLIIFEGKTTTMRLAVGQDRGLPAFTNASEFVFQVRPGFNTFTVNRLCFKTIRGNPNLKIINRIAVGGKTDNARMDVYLYDEQGNSIF